MSNHYAYILASRRDGTLYVGVTSDLLRRVYEHKNDPVEGFTKKYGVYRLVYFEVCRDREGAIQREKQIKEWERRWEIALTSTQNFLYTAASTTIGLALFRSILSL